MLHWTAYEFPLGGKFPRSIYQSVVSDMETVASCMALMSHTTKGIDLMSRMTELRDGDSGRSGVEERWIHQLVGATKSPDVRDGCYCSA